MAAETLAACMAAIKVNPARFYVYILSRPDGTPFYVGKGQAERIIEHEREARLGRRGHKISIIRKIWNGGGEVLYRIDGHFSEEQDAFAAEKRIIAAIGRIKNGGPLVNQTDGGDGVSGFSQVITPEMRAKISASLTGKKKSPEHVAKVAAKRRGCTHDEASRARISAGVRRPEAMAKIVAFRAVFRHSDATKVKIGLLKTGIRASPETRSKMSASQRGKIMSQEAREKIRAAAFARPPMSEETKAKIRAARARQAPMSDEGRAKCAATAREMQARRRAAKAQP